MRIRHAFAGLCLTAGALLTVAPAFASSHREAPAITKTPKVDGTDFYLFNSYEPGRNGFVTLIANYIPLQDAYGGPNYFALDPEAVYRIHVDNDGDGVEDITFQFRFAELLRDIQLPIGTKTNTLLARPLVKVSGCSTVSVRSGLHSDKLKVMHRVSGEIISGDNSTLTTSSL
jgi:hypothetical protein